MICMSAQDDGEFCNENDPFNRFGVRVDYAKCWHWRLRWSMSLAG